MRWLAPALLGLLASASCSGEVLLGESTTEEKRIRSPDIPYTVVDKLDLLFVVDNSPSMADKQRVLALAIPELVERFANPVCVDRVSGNQVGTVGPGEPCAFTHPGSVREIDPPKSIHVGVITSSLGGHGSDACVSTPGGPHLNDGSHLIDRGRDESGTNVQVETYANLGFLNWDPSAHAMPPGEDRIDSFQTHFANLVRGAGQDGCGFEASLEAWYRFLIDPAPHQRMAPAPCYEGDEQLRCRAPEGIDQVVLAQRADFLRSDSLVAIVMLTDENDCSLSYGPQSYLALQGHDGADPFHVAHGTSACARDPWDPDCRSCWEVDPEAYPECDVGWPDASKDDTLSLRCFDQKRRFGIDFLHPVRRYVDALTDSRREDGTLNPLFCGRATDETRTKCAEVLRASWLIYFAGIVGVPWQDIAIDPNDLSRGYRSTEEFSWTPKDFVGNGQTPPPGLPDGKTLWNLILGDVDERPGTDIDGDGLLRGDEKNGSFGAIVPTVDPLDPLMIESIDPREGENPVTGYRLVPPDGDPFGNPIHGAERTVAERDDLQYACTFDLGQLGPIDCSLGENVSGCDCSLSPENPLCWDEKAQSYGTWQFRAKAYPSRRQLAVIKALDTHGIAASVCPANLHDPSAADFGYRPAVQAIVDRLAPRLRGSSCLFEELSILPDGSVDCEVVEATRGDLDDAGNVHCPPCEGLRSDPSAKVRTSILADPVYRDNGLNCLCALRQTPPGPELDACVGELSVHEVDGWCYVDPGQRDDHNEELVANCPPGRERTIRFVGGAPASGSLTFLRCLGASF